MLHTQQYYRKSPSTSPWGGRKTQPALALSPPPTSAPAGRPPASEPHRSLRPLPSRDLGHGLPGPGAASVGSFCVSEEPQPPSRVTQQTRANPCLSQTKMKPCRPPWGSRPNTEAPQIASNADVSLPQVCSGHRSGDKVSGERSRVGAWLEKMSPVEPSSGGRGPLYWGVREGLATRTPGSAQLQGAPLL